MSDSAVQVALYFRSIQSRYSVYSTILGQDGREKTDQIKNYTNIKSEPQDLHLQNVFIELDLYAMP